VIELIVCVNFRPFSGQPSCALRGSRELADWLEEEIRECGLAARVERIVCMGHCTKGPNVKVKAGELIHEANREQLRMMIRQMQAEQEAGDESI